MGNKINIAEILKNKQQGTKLYSKICGAVELKEVLDVHKKKSIVVKELNSNNQHRFWYDGKFFRTGQCVLQPSKEMADWSKFAWKKGDILVSNDGGIEVIFDKWYDETYTSFYCKHYLNSEDENKIVYYDAFLCTTERYSLEDKDSVQTYINTIEKRLGGKLNRETLNIDKQTEFKDGDIVAVDLERKNIRIFKEKENENNFRWGKYYIGFSFNNEGKPIQKFENYRADCTSDRLATDLEKQQLFSALAKEGKAWDAEKKMIVDLKKKVELKPFDKVVVRCSEADRWSIDFFSYKVHNGYICTGDAWFGYCLPYNDETAHLLGTTDDWEGGKHD